MIRKELGIFLVVGCLTVLVDYLTYRGLAWTDLMTTNMAKGTSFIAGTVFAYFANQLWTFGHAKHAPGSAWKFILVYGVTLLVNISVNAIVLNRTATIRQSVQIAFVIATGLSAVLNFLGMKFFVFKPRSTGVTP